jgi:hypothetical protein
MSFISFHGSDAPDEGVEGRGKNACKRRRERGGERATDILYHFHVNALDEMEEMSAPDEGVEGPGVLDEGPEEGHAPRPQHEDG